MSTKLLFAAFIIFSFVLGWSTGVQWHQRDAVTPTPGSIVATPPDTVSPPATDSASLPASTGSGPFSASSGDGYDRNTCECPSAEAERPPDPTFAALLQQRRFEEALRLYRRAVEDGAVHRHDLRKQLLTFMRLKVQQLNYREFIELAGLFLEEYYDDTEVLLLAAAFNQRMGYLEEAIGLFQQAQLYAYQPAQKRQVAAAYDEFVRTVDAFLGKQGRWAELSSFYVHTDTVGLIRPADKIRLAQLYYLAGNPTLGREVLASLDDDPHWRDKAAQALRQWDAEQPSVAAEERDARRSAEAIALRSRGEHYLVPVYFEDQAAHLILDTGASMLTLTRERFDALPRNLDIVPLGSRMFHTANGVSNGSVYRVEALTIGSYMLRDVNVAVLEVSMGDDADGLLGMNVLKHFKFEIDQDDNRLLLEAR